MDALFDGLLEAFLEFLFDLVFDESYLSSENSKLLKPIRYVIFIVAALFMVGLILAILGFGIYILPTTKAGGIALIVLGVGLLFIVIRQVRKISRKRKEKKQDVFSADYDPSEQR